MAINVKIKNYELGRVIDNMTIEGSDTPIDIITRLLDYWDLKFEPEDPFFLYRLDGTLLIGTAEFSKIGIADGEELIFARKSKANQWFVKPPVEEQLPEPELEEKPEEELVELKREEIVEPKPTMAVSIFAPPTLRIKEKKTKKIRIGHEVGSGLGLDQGDLIKVLDESSGIFVVGKVEIDKRLEKDIVELDQTMIDSLGSDEDASVKIEKFEEGNLKQLNSVTFGIKPITGAEDANTILRVREKEKELLKFMDKSIIVKGQKFRWEEENVIVSILETEPDLMGDEVAMISNEFLGEFHYKLVTEEPPFDGILLIDASYSMNIKDMPITNIAHGIAYMENEMKGEEVKAFLKNFVDGTETKRYYGATLAALMYLAGKISRGKGEKVSIILFSSTPTVVKFGEQNYYDASLGHDISLMATQIIKAVSSIEKLGTNMGMGLMKALEIIEEYGTGKLKMIVLLTDGYPDDEDEMKSVLNKYISPRNDIILFVAGIGKEVNTPLMKEAASRCGGEYLQVGNLDQLTEWYSSLARKLTFKGKL
ncbi:MAG: vWA domain-containing protein [Candidatus Thermoplasmatota archaeon]